MKMGPRKEERVREAALRKEVSSKRSPQERIQALDAILGVGIGAKRERARLTPSKKPPITALATTTGAGFVLTVNNKPIAIQSVSQLRRLGDQAGFDPKPIIKDFLTFKKGQ